LTRSEWRVRAYPRSSLRTQTRAAVSSGVLDQSLQPRPCRGRAGRVRRSTSWRGSCGRGGRVLPSTGCRRPPARCRDSAEGRAADTSTRPRPATSRTRRSIDPDSTRRTHPPTVRTRMRPAAGSHRTVMRSPPPDDGAQPATRPWRHRATRYEPDESWCPLDVSTGTVENDGPRNDEVATLEIDVGPSDRAELTAPGTTRRREAQERGQLLIDFLGTAEQCRDLCRKWRRDARLRTPRWIDLPERIRRPVAPAHRRLEQCTEDAVHRPDARGGQGATTGSFTAPQRGVELLDVGRSDAIDALGPDGGEDATVEQASVFVSRGRRQLVRAGLPPGCARSSTVPARLGPTRPPSTSDISWARRRSASCRLPVTVSYR